MNKPLTKSLLRRRMSCPEWVQQIWDTIKILRNQSQIPTKEKVTKHMIKTYSRNEEDLSKQLQNCVRDGLLHMKKTKTKGGEQETYRLPEQHEGVNREDPHDWYCFKCQSYGDVLLCQNCHRVYHMACISNSPDKFICSVCQSCDEDSSLSHVTKTKLNRVLSIICRHLHDKFPTLNESNTFLQRSIFVSMLGANVDISASKESWRVPFLICKPMDLSIMKATAKADIYRNVSEFMAHAEQILHNIVIFHGRNSGQAVTAREMLRICEAEVKEMRVCPTCFERPVLKVKKKDWFVQPCKPPHPLVFAGSPYMPAKVLEEKDGKTLVVFFGPEHSRKIVDTGSTLPIDTPIGHLDKSSSWSKAMEQLSRHQKMIADKVFSSSSDEEVEKPSLAEGLAKRKEPLKMAVKELASTPAKALKTSAAKSERLSSGKEDSKKKTDAGKRKRGRPRKGSFDSPAPWLSDRPKRNITKVIYDSNDEDLEDEGDEEDEDDGETKKEAVKRRRAKAPKDKSSPLESPTKRKMRGRKGKKESKEEEMDEDGEEERRKELLGGGEPLDDEESAAMSQVKAESRRAESPTTTVSPLSVTKKNEEEIVSSSCTEPRSCSVGTQTNKEVIAKLQEDLEEVRTSHAALLKELKELKELREAHAAEIAATKKKQWCYNCESEAIYHCCWNTAYCSTTCQQEHWQAEHKRVCRRKR